MRLWYLPADAIPKEMSSVTEQAQPDAAHDKDVAAELLFQQEQFYRPPARLGNVQECPHPQRPRHGAGTVPLRRRVQ